MMGDVESVFAMSTTALVDIEAEDTAIVTLKFKNGALGIIEATTAVRPKDLEALFPYLVRLAQLKLAVLQLMK